jgi:hypothetical protein
MVRPCKSLHGKLEDYPSSDEDPLASARRVNLLLRTQAMAADVAMQLRDRIKTESCIEQFEYQRVLDELIGRAELLNKRYLAFWDLVVGKMGLSIEFPLTPQTFREKYRVKMYK